MKKSKGMAIVAGAGVLVIGACVAMAADQAIKNVPAQSKLSLSPLSMADIDKGFLVAQAPEAGPSIGLHAAEGGIQVGVKQEFSTWSDLTAMFRPSRWKNPFREGGSLSWLNYKAWGNAPARTGKVFLGEAIVAGAVVAVASAGGGGGGGGDDKKPTTTSTPATSGGSSGGGSSSSGGGSSSSGSSTSSSSSSSGSSTSSSGSSTSSSGSSTSSSGSSTSSSGGETW